MLVVLEGLDGAGKSTVAALIADQLGDAILSAAPNPEYRELLFGGRKPAPAAELLLFLADMAQTCEDLAPDLDAGRIVIQDRWTGSTLAYRAGRDLGGIPLDELIRAAVRPADLVIVLDADLDILAGRVGARGGGNRYDEAGRAFREGIRAAYLDQAARSPGDHVVVDASRPADEVAEACLRIIEEREFGIESARPIR